MFWEVVFCWNDCFTAFTAVLRPKPNEDLFRDGFRQMVVGYWGGWIIVEELAEPKQVAVALSKALMIDFLIVKRFTESGGLVVKRS